MKTKSYILNRNRIILEEISIDCKILAICSLLISFYGLIKNQQHAILFFIASLIFVLGHAFCVSLLNYRKCLKGEFIFGSRIARSIFILRDAKNFKARYYRTHGI